VRRGVAAIARSTIGTQLHVQSYTTGAAAVATGYTRNKPAPFPVVGPRRDLPSVVRPGACLIEIFFPTSTRLTAELGPPPVLFRGRWGIARR
jgi:hypothetical protein